MLSSVYAKGRQNSLMGEYSSIIGDAFLRRRTRTAEQAARIEAELANKVKSEFISNMSHELRTPLNTMLGFSKLLTEHDTRKIPDEEVAEYARLIHDAAGHLLSVINNILDVSKIQCGKYTLDAHEVALDEVLAGVVKSAHAAIQDANVKLETIIPKNLPRVSGDEAKLRQIFSNLLSNAIKFTPAGGQVTVECKQARDGGIATYIRDTGIGMSSEEVDIAMSPFGQVDGNRSRWREGTGLGLTIAKELTALHGGEFNIASERGTGTTVSITLPPASRISVAEGRDAILGKGI